MASLYDTLNEANSTVTGVLASLGSGAEGVVREIEQANARALSLFTAGVQSSVNAGQQIIKSSIDAGTAYIQQARAGVARLFGSVVTGLGMIRGAVISGIGSAVGAAASMAVSVGQRVASFIAGLAPTLMAGIGTAIGGAGTALGVLLAPLRALTSITPVALAVLGGLATAAGIGIAIAQRTVSAFAISAQLYGTIGTALRTGFQAAAGIATNIGGVLRSGLTFVSNALQSAFAAVSSVVRTLWSWAQSAGSFVAANIGSVISAISSLAATALKAGVAMGQVVVAGSALAAFAGLVYAAGNAAVEFARSARDLSGVTGFGLGKSAGLLDRLGIQGIGAGSVQSVFANQSPFAASMKAQAFGLSGGPDSAGFLSSLSRRFQSLNNGGPAMQMMAQTMVKSLGLGPEFVRAAQTSPSTQRANSAFQRTIDSNLGLSPGALSKYAEEIPAMLQRISYGASKALQTLASIALPIVEQIVGFGTRFIGDNAGKIRDFLGNLTRSMFVKVGPMFIEGATTLIGMFAGLVTNLVKWGQWLVDNLANVLANGATVVSGVLRGWSDALAEWAPSFLSGFAGFLSQLGLSAGNAIAAVTSYIGQTLQKFGAWVHSTWSAGGGPMGTLALTIANALDGVLNTSRSFALGMSNIAVSINNAIVKYLPFAAGKLGLTMITPQQAQQAATGGMGPSTLGPDLQRFLAGPTLPRFGANIAQSGTDLQNWGMGASANFQAQMNTLASGVYTNGMAISNFAQRGLNGAANGLTSPDGKYNLGQNVGAGIAGFIKPGVDALARLEPGIQDFAAAAQAYKASLGNERERNSRFDKLIALQEESNNAQRTLVELGRKQLEGGIDKSASNRQIFGMLREFGLDSGRGTYAGGGTGS